jgi:hypothetical protein
MTNTNRRGSAITPPDSTTSAEIARVMKVREILNADPRTSGDANRPTWLVERVLRDAGRADLVLG